MDKKIFSILIIAILVGSILSISGCNVKPPYTSVVGKEIPKFKDYNELVGAFKKAQLSGGYGGYSRGFGIGDMLMSTTSMKSSAESATNAAPQATGGTTDYSKTNVQVEGVDEADIVKSDGKYIYNISQGRLIITDAYPIENSSIVSKTDLNELGPVEMFISGDKLVLFGTKYRYLVYNYYDQVAGKTMARCAIGGEILQNYQDGAARCVIPPYEGSGAAVRLYDISNRDAPTIEKEIEFQGSYVDSRMIGNNVYFVIESYPDYRAFIYKDGNIDTNNEINIIPMIIENGKAKRVAEPTDIGYLPPMRVDQFITIASIKIDSGEMQKETVVGDAGNIYASAENIYISANVWPDYTPLYELQRRIADGNITDANTIAKMIEAANIDSTEKTVVNKFALEDGKIVFMGQGAVPGYILNQFSMDEYNGNFRIATTKHPQNNWWIQSIVGGPTETPKSTNNVYVLDSNMGIVGRLEDLAPGETIYAVRFMGERGYVVTFKKVDPLFVIGLDNPSEPKVLGKLKIPGFSDYLHPIDATHIIGVGKEAVESTYGDFAWYQGMKMAIFDVSDVANPIEMHKVTIGDRGTTSYALDDHKAFLYDKAKELLVLPVTLYEIKDKEEPRPTTWGPSYGEPVFQGAIVYKVTLENGFEERGKITHVTPEEELKKGYYYGDETNIKRAMYIGNVLYTLSDLKLKANSLDALEELKTFEFGKGNTYGYYGYGSSVGGSPGIMWESVDATVTSK
ncbi:MAG: beta-propeller domain-containing protein [Candidatus Diapherotrites archaeon]|nr:beta-propeller domain-containing protein [Candidatus Diapherotrites archaeon]